ncbi:dipeptidase [Persicobacter psychrovividus]|uniref:Peptidase M20 dimerisation domain-containing protein n=1 Tax=Persicobacter psychrovividus TaxID=387638 RepID=A0ABN6L492_9BACT|nr:hypothetical protein PEPS_01810 [Persicobacter psychrovividus]
MEAKSFIEANKDRFLNELFDLLRIPSVSADPKFAGDVQKTAEFIKDRFAEAGAENIEIVPTNGHPVVYADKIIDESLPTVLVYGHYDVQPADPYELWETEPFEPAVRNNRIYARGASDDKGQAYMHLKAFEAMQTLGQPVNLKFMIEGEEEIGSKHLGEFVKANKERLKADVILISDTGLFSMDCPSICSGLRGLSYLEVEVTGPNRDLHSGQYGGAVANPINVLAEMIASLKDEKGSITVPGFYDNVIEVSKEEREQLNKAPFSLEEYQKDLGIDAVSGEDGYTTIERTGIRPSLDVNGIWGGYIGEGAKTVLPSQAFAKISMRLVPGQKSEEITQLFKKHFESIAPDCVKVKVTPHHGGEASVTNIDSAGFRAASNAFEKVWGKPAIPMREGGSIPIVALFKEELGLNSILMGFGLDEDTIHSPNESYGIDNYLMGIETIIEFHKEFAEMNK